MPSLNIFNKQSKIAKDEDFDANYYGVEEGYEVPTKEEKPAREKPATPARPTFGASMSAPVQMKLIRPTAFADGQTVADALMGNHPVLIHLENTTKEISHDLVCFLTGVVYAIGGQIQMVSETTYMLSPRSMEIAEESVKSEQPTEDESCGFVGSSGVGGYGY